MDEALFLSKLKRYVQTGGVLSGLGVRMLADNKLSYKVDHERYAQDLTQTLGSMKGPLMKVAQFLSTIPGALPAEYAHHLQTLQSHAPPMGPYFVKRRMKSELGENWLNHFQDFSMEPAFAASLGQVHKGVLSDESLAVDYVSGQSLAAGAVGGTGQGINTVTGEQVAVKLQYAHMESMVSADVNQLQALVGMYRYFHQALDLENVMEEIKEHLFQELDYEQEAQNQQEYGDFFQNHPRIRVPRVYPHLSTKRLLVSEWVSGDHILDKDLTPEERNTIGEALFQAWYRPFYLKGWIHGDPHPGNYKIDHKGQLWLLDFGCVRKFNPLFVEGVVTLYHGLQQNNDDMMDAAYSLWGFQGISREVRDVLTQWARLLYDPLLDDRVRPIQYDTTTGWTVATNIHQRLDALGGVKVPREFVFMDRAAVGIGSVLMRLGCQLNWHQLFASILQERSQQI